MRKLFSNKLIYYIEKHRVASSVIKMAFFAHGGISIKLFVLYLHIINDCLSYKFHPYSILTEHTKVESVAYEVLSSVCLLRKRLKKHCYKKSTASISKKCEERAKSQEQQTYRIASLPCE
jgi:hypothetical protein